MSVSKRLRYEVLRRDDYTCRYCGAKAPDVKITVDHVVPVALGGSDDPSNLVAACGDCNGGKTSSSPDAPLVAEVADDALRWAEAMRQAQAKMHADIEARGRDQACFEQWWDSWGRGEGKDRELIPKDPAWWVTVTQLVTAGLPLPVLKDCIELAMTRRNVKDENKFRYMCGIAWNKVTEMQKTAQAFAGRPPAADDNAAGSGPAPGADRFEEGRLSLANELLGEIGEEERVHFLNACDLAGWQDEGDEPQTETQHACDAVAALINSARCNVDWLVGHIRKTFDGLAPEIGEPCLAEMREDMALADPISRLAWQGINGLWALGDLIDLPAAKTWAAGLAEGERLEWLEYAHALQPQAQIGDERWLTRAWECAQVIASGRHYTEMCSATGAHITDCPARGAYWAVIAELNCCGPDRADDHKGHLVCERHLERLMDGTYSGRGGRIFTTTDFTEIPADLTTAPF